MNNEVSEVKLSYKSKVKASERPKVLDSKTSFDILFKSFDPDTIELKETMKMLLLNNANKVLGIMDVSTGGTMGTVADIKLIMQCALLSNAGGIIISHNHPSGILTASVQDDSITRRLKQACELMEIRFLDHVIITTESYYSYADEGRL